ncbi:hypothetical protein B296_00037457 [Ensete ventricosum]|uniref:Uncharacterized protein n=1 Tax=Ensete ventricosum TaxID=4639 RepID=A0A426YRZ4_ENSVE|nr:hypothetical protein B296_00037457 [Ensete ventricosum]
MSLISSSSVSLDPCRFTLHRDLPPRHRGSHYHLYAPAVLLLSGGTSCGWVTPPCVGVAPSGNSPGRGGCPVAASSQATATVACAIGRPCRHRVASDRPCGRRTAANPGRGLPSHPLQVTIPRRGPWPSRVAVLGQFSSRAAVLGQFSSLAAVFSQFSSRASVLDQFSSRAVVLDQFSSRATVLGQFNSRAIMLGQFSFKAAVLG